MREGNLTDLQTGFMQWLVQFHWRFQLGLPGLLLTTIFGLTMLLSILTGLLIYWKFVWKVLLFRVRFKWNNWRTLSSSLHRIVGVWALVFNVIIFFTGFWMNKFSMDQDYWKKQTMVAAPNTLSLQSIDDLYLIAKKRMPELLVNNIYLPTQPEKSFIIRGAVKGQLSVFNSANSISIDPVTGRVTAIQRISDKGLWGKIEASFFALHVGNYGGVPVKILYVIIGLLPGLLSITGALLWWRKRIRT